jgi:hypothetical protein
MKGEIVEKLEEMRGILEKECRKIMHTSADVVRIFD